MKQKGSLSIYIIILALVGLFAVGQIIYNFNLLQVPARTHDSFGKDVTCYKPTNFSIQYPQDVSFRSYRIYDNDSTCFFDLTDPKFNIFIAPTGKYHEWGAYGPGLVPTKRPYSVSVGDQVVNGEEAVSSNGGSSVILKGIKGYDFGITFNDQSGDSKKEVANILKTFKLTK